MNRIVLHIDRLVLRGFAHQERTSIATQLQGELSRLLGEPSSARRLASLGSVPRVDAGKITANPGTTGVSAARAVSKGLLR